MDADTVGRNAHVMLELTFHMAGAQLPQTMNLPAWVRTFDPSSRHRFFLLHERQSINMMNNDNDTLVSSSNNDTTTDPEEGVALPQGAHLNFMGAPSYKLGSALTTLQIMAASSFFGEPSYYGSPSRKMSTASDKISDPRDHLARNQGHLGSLVVKRFQGSSAQQMAEAIDAALEEDAEGTLQLAVRLRRQDHIRTTPQVILVRAAKHEKVRGTNLISRYAPFITSRPDEPMVQKAYHDAAFGTSKYPNALKKFWASYLGGLTDFKAAKYRNAVQGHPMVDLVNLTHPKATETLTKLVKGELKLEEGDTWESMISAKGSTKENWEQAVAVMGHMALLRNLRNFNDKGVNPEVYLPKLLSTAENGKQLPFRYFSAYQAIGGSLAPKDLVAALDECMRISLGSLPHFKGRSMSLCDNSGSAHGAHTSEWGSTTVATIANLTALITALISDHGHVGVFGDTLKTIDISAGVRSPLKILEQVNALGHQVGGSTENGIWLFWRDAIKKKQHWDNVFVYSDMQAGHGGLYGVNATDYRQHLVGYRNIDVPSLVAQYRREVNPRVNVYLVQVAGYSDTIIPEAYYRTFILGGWSAGLLRYAHQMAEIFDGSDRVTHTNS